jgi:hypothetical protein
LNSGVRSSFLEKITDSKKSIAFEKWKYATSYKNPKKKLEFEMKNPLKVE